MLLLLGGMQGWGTGMWEGVGEGCRKGVQSHAGVTGMQGGFRKDDEGCREDLLECRRGVGRI